MGRRFQNWHAKTASIPHNGGELLTILRKNRQFEPLSELNYGDFGLDEVFKKVCQAVERQARIALYADYDVDGTMSCVSWIWFFQAIGYENYFYYIPCRFSEGYGLNLKAVTYLVEKKGCEVIITMDTGITANEEAAYCRQRGVDFICTDHHTIQREKMPDCLILNPKLHPDMNYQELCGCGITFVLLRKLGRRFPTNRKLWIDLLALAGIATICDIVKLNPVNHELARKGVAAILKSDRRVLKSLRQSCSLEGDVDEKDVGFRIGPRINAVGRLGHASEVIQAFIKDDPEPLIKYMNTCNEDRKQIQKHILREAEDLAIHFQEDPILFLGGDWHTGVVGIAASRISEIFWRPTWLFHRGSDLCKGSARSIPGFHLVKSMEICGKLFDKFGGHRAAAGFSFPADRESEIHQAIKEYAAEIRSGQPDLWFSSVEYDCQLPASLSTLKLAERLSELKPFGHGFDEPLFLLKAKIRGVNHYADRKTGEKAHTAVNIEKDG